MSWQELLVIAMKDMNTTFMLVCITLIAAVTLGPYFWWLNRNFRRANDQHHEIKLLEEQAKRHQGKFLEAKPEREERRDRREDY